ncbi:MAG TPA: GNAT family N-acetyltransferase [Candidatus Saccharimonadales bacterium]|nr:GNAT family N-acetyltransferase [Candidatus Saccharimonadales bacterium]
MPVSKDAEIRIRPLREADIESIIEIDAEITGEGKPGFWRGLLTLYEPGQEGENLHEDPATARSHPTWLCEVAEREGRVVGFVLGDIQAWQFGIPRCGRIIAIGVRPDHRRDGVASRLAREILEAFRKMNLPIVQCLVRTGDPLGEFFASLGFETSPWITMEKRLD